MAYTIGLFSLLWEKVLIMQSTHIKKKNKNSFWVADHHHGVVTQIVFFFFSSRAGDWTRTLCVLDKYTTTELHAQLKVIVKVK
jgi:hypothetical protein